MKNLPSVVLVVEMFQRCGNWIIFKGLVTDTTPDASVKGSGERKKNGVYVILIRTTSLKTITA